MGVNCCSSEDVVKEKGELIYTGGSPIMSQADEIVHLNPYSTTFSSLN